jgi:uncharacterized protein with von Willebrand factor type A (vWA) domain
MTTTARHDPDELLLGFARALRAAGVPVTHDRATAWLEAASLVGAGSRQPVYWAGRATLCAGPDDLARYDQVFEAWFLEEAAPRRGAPARSRAETPDASLTEGEGLGEAADPLAVRASEAEVLRHRDVASLSGAEQELLHRLIGGLRPRAPRHRAHRRTPSRRGELDASRTLRATLRRMGEPGELVWRRHGTRPRRVVLLVDVSGSMSGYADALLRVAHRFVVGLPAVDVFTTGTRLTRVTRALRTGDPERALVAAGETVPDWAGGTRLGETLKAYLDRWGQRGQARGAVVVLFSDGWERGGTDLLGDQLDRLRRIAHRVVWVNPHRGKEGYEPLQAGIVAALPHVDDFLAGHSLATFEYLCEVVARA